MKTSNEGGGAAALESVISPRGTLIVLLVTTAILLLGAGLFGTLLGVRASLEEFPTSMIGLIQSAYFGGFIVGTFVCSIIIGHVGHIRAFAAFAAVFTTMALAHSVWVAVLPWILFRFVSGVAVVGLSLIIESWLNAQAEAGNRGRIFSTYMVVNLSAVAIGQLLLTAGDPLAFALFAVAAMLFALSLVPTALIRVQAPAPHGPTGLNITALFAVSPVGVAGCFAAGLSGGVFWGMAPVFVTEIGHGQEQVALFMFTAIVGGMLSQLPVGRFSDGRDRRHVILGVAFVAALTAALLVAASFGRFGGLAAAALLFGAAMFPLYGLSVARVHDLLTPTQALEATRGLLLIFGVGAAFGPFTGGLVMSAIAPAALFGWVALIFVVLLLFGAYRLGRGEAVPPDAQSNYVPVIATTQEALEMAEADAYSRADDAFE